MQQIFIIGGGIVLLVLVAVVILLAKKRKANKGANSTNRLASSLQNEKEKSAIILGAIQDGVVLIDDQQIIRHFNQGAVTTTGWARNEAEGLDWRSVLKFTDTKGEELPAEETPIAKVFSSGKQTRNDSANMLIKSGTSISTSFSVSPLADSAEHTTGLVAVFRDVSEERAQENQRAEFISTASHEMRTPVAAIEGYLSLALNDKVATIDGRAKGYLEKAHSSTQHLGQLFQDLLTSAKAEDGRLVSHPSVVEMGSFIEQLAEDLRFSAEKKGLFTEFLFGNSEIKDASHSATSTEGNKVVRPLYYVNVDADRVREVVTNIFDNACKYTAEGKVSLGLTGNDGVVQVYVRDTGQGIPAEDLPHLFQKFYRVDNSATRTIGGTGLGLFICRKIVELYKGRIWVESEVGKGSTFYINLPRLSLQRAEQLMAAESNAQVTGSANTTAAKPENLVTPTTQPGATA